MPYWRASLRQEWTSAPDRATREYLLGIYAERIAALSEEEREELFSELTDFGC